MKYKQERYRRVQTYSPSPTIPLALSLLSAGEAFEVSEDFEPLDLNQLVTGGREGFLACLVTGESMLPHIRNGDLVFVDTMAVPKNGDTIVASVNGQNNIKMFQQRKSELYLVPQNGNYKPRKIKASDTFRVIGVVRWHLSAERI